MKCIDHNLTSRVPNVIGLLESFLRDLYGKTYSKWQSTQYYIFDCLIPEKESIITDENIFIKNLITNFGLKL